MTCFQCVRVVMQARVSERGLRLVQSAWVALMVSKEWQLLLVGSRGGAKGGAQAQGPPYASVAAQSGNLLLTVYFGAPSLFITLWFGFDYGTNPPLGTLII
jgi:hypothetical protein